MTSIQKAKTLKALYQVFLPLSVIFLVLYASGLELVSGFVRDADHFIIGRDFLNFWMAGKAAFAENPGQYYDRLFYWEQLARIAGEGYQQIMSYPPTLMLAAAPFALMPYHVALLIWTVLGAGLLYRVTRAEDKECGRLLMVSPALLLCILCGQNSMFMAVLIILVFRWMDTRPTLAGVMLGLLTIKPQLGLLFPLMLIASRRWKVLAAATATTLAMIGLVTLLFGVSTITAYLGEGMAAQRLVLTNADDMLKLMMSTVYIDMRILGHDTESAMVVQGLFSVAMAALVVWVFARKRDPQLSFVVFIAASVMATPYLMAYDLIALTWASALLLRHPAMDKKGRALAVYTAALPLLHFFAGAMNFAGMALLPLFVILWCLPHLRHVPPQNGAIPGET